MTTEAVKRSELTEARARIYRLLATVYVKPPDLDFLRVISGWASSLTETEESLGMLPAQMRRGLDTLRSFFEKVEEDSWENLEETISIEFTMLFRGVNRRHSPLPPYESLYRDEARRTFGDLTVEVHDQYRRFGLDLTNSLQGEPPDHISFELEFMSILCNRETEAWQKDDQDQASQLLLAEREFLREHLMTWLPKFCAKVRESDRLGLFSGLAELTEGWIGFDYQTHLQNDQEVASV